MLPDLTDAAVGITVGPKVTRAARRGLLRHADPVAGSLGRDAAIEKWRGRSDLDAEASGVVGRTPSCHATSSCSTSRPAPFHPRFVERPGRTRDRRRSGRWCDCRPNGPSSSSSSTGDRSPNVCDDTVVADGAAEPISVFREIEVEIVDRDALARRLSRRSSPGFVTAGCKDDEAPVPKATPRARPAGVRSSRRRHSEGREARDRRPVGAELVGQVGDATDRSARQGVRRRRSRRPAPVPRRQLADFAPISERSHRCSTVT